jgi:hypothetical protein
MIQKENRRKWVEGAPKESKIPKTPEAYVAKGLIYLVIGLLGKFLFPVKKE